MVALPIAAARADEASAYQQKATAAFALGEYKEAAEDFERAFKLHPDPALLYNAAQSHRLGGNKERALTLYENYLRVYGKKNGRAEEVQKHIDNLKAAIERDKTAATSPPPGTSPASAEAPRASAAVTAPAPATARPATAPPPATAAVRPTAPPPATAAARPATTPPSVSAAARPATAPPPATVAAQPSAAPPPATAAPRPATAPPPAVTTAPPPTEPSTPVLVAQPTAKTSDEGSVTQKAWFWVVVGGVVAGAAVGAILLARGGVTRDPSPSLGAANGYPP
jgi:hypothetical protein